MPRVVCTFLKGDGVLAVMAQLVLGTNRPQVRFLVGRQQINVFLSPSSFLSLESVKSLSWGEDFF